VAADGGTVRVTRFAAKAGPGTIEASGSLDLTAPGEPLDLTFTARGARPLANDLLTADLDADLTLRGEMAGKLTAAGRIFVRHADIRIPERLPTGIAVLDVRVAGAPPPPPPPAPGPNLALDLTIEAPQQIFVRGRGLNAEMAGTVHVQGSTTNPIPSGGFTLRQGDFSMAGQTLTFSTGQVSFDGGSLTDPSLNFTATTTAGDVTATLAITGTASRPKIALTSVPSLPQDEVLAYLLYGTPTTSLGPLEIAQIAATLASLAGVAPTLTNPLESLRTTFGLDRLTIGAGSSLEAGRYVARNVYVGARQNVTGSGTQAVVQVDLAKGLKLEATAGTSNAGTSTGGTATGQSATGAGGSADAASVGIKYEFEY
jgi:translocation and assembly module TamB